MVFYIMVKKAFWYGGLYLQKHFGDISKKGLVRIFVVNRKCACFQEDTLDLVDVEVR